MITNLLASARRSLIRDRVFAVIAIGGLAIGIWAALLAALMLHQQLSYEHFMEGHEDVYQAVTTVVPPGQPPTVMALSSAAFPAMLRAQHPQVQATTRLLKAEVSLIGPRGPSVEEAYWADSTALEVLRLPLAAGERSGALERPGSIVLSRGTALRLFGTDRALGRTLHIGETPLTVTAIAEDLPTERTRLETATLIAAHTASSPLAALDANPADFSLRVASFVRLAPGGRAAALRSSMEELTGRFSARIPPGWTARFEMIRLDRVPAHEGLNPGFGARIAMLAALGAITLAIAGLNFVNLTTARASRRVREIGIRKAAGATRGQLVLQFLAEAAFCAALAALLAIALVEWSLPRANTLLETQASLRALASPQGVFACVLGLVTLALAAGAWPALLLSRLRPASALGLRASLPGGRTARSALVALQFSMLIALAIAAGVMWLQRSFALREALRADTEQVLVMRARCPEGFISELRRTAGVEAVACGSNSLLSTPGITTLQLRPGEWQLLHVIDAEPALLKLLGIEPLAGSLDAKSAPADYPHAHYLINDTARRRLGFELPEGALGPYEMPLGPQTPPGREIVAVVPEFSFASIVRPVEPLVYLPRREAYDLVFAKLAAGELGSTLAAIDQAWRRTGGDGALERFFVDEHMQRVYRALSREVQAFGLFCVLALLLSCIGLLGLSAAGAARRTREVAVRKALGAHPGEVIRLLLGQALTPVLWASLIGWPAAAWAMQRWLQGFAYHISLPLWLFPLATLAAAVLAALALLALVRRIANAPPARGLRYE